MVRHNNIKTSILVCWFAGLLVCWLTGCTKREIKNIDSRGTDIICFGDSITMGYGVNPGQDYPSLLSTMLNRPIINSGIDGDTTSEAVKRLKGDVLDRNPLLVIVEFGGNDFLRKVPKEVTLENIRFMVDKIQEKGAMVAIADVSAGMLLGEYRGALARLSREKDAIFISSLLNGIITDARLKSDFLHPNSEGYQLVAKRVYQQILPHLTKNALIRREGK